MYVFVNRKVAVQMNSPQIYATVLFTLTVKVRIMHENTDKAENETYYM